MSVKTPLSPAVKRGLLWPYRSWKNRVAVWNFVKDIPLGPKHSSYEVLKGVEEGLERIKDKPIQLVWGSRDFCFNMHFYNQWLAFFPNASKHLYERYGHYVLEDGKDEVTRVITNHLEV